MQFLITFFSKKDWIKTNMIFYLTRPLLLGEAPHPLLNTLASPKSFTLGNVQMHLTLLSLNQDFPLLRSGGLKAWPAGPVRANKLSP